jgi:hypothetical protein
MDSRREFRKDVKILKARRANYVWESHKGLAEVREDGAGTSQW